TNSESRPGLTQARPALNTPAAAPKLTSPSAPTAVATTSPAVTEPVAGPQSEALQAATPAAAPVAPTPPAKPRKSKELLFLDVGLPKPKTPPRPDPLDAELFGPRGGHESTLGSSNGHGTITEDRAPVSAPPAPAPVQEKAAPVQEKAAPVQERAAPTREKAASKPVENGSNVWTPTLDRTPFSNLAVPPSVPKPRPQAQVDLGVEAPPVELVAAPAPIHHRAEKSRMGLVAGGVGAFALLGIVAFVWKPWASNGTPEAAAPTTVATAADKAANGSQLVHPAGAQSVPNTGSPVAGTAQNPPATDKPGSALVDSAKSDQIVAAVRPDFRAAKLDMSAPDVELSAITSGGSGVSPSELTRRYGVAASAARQELGSKLMAAGFIRIFSASRLSSSEGVTDVASAWSAGSEAISQYRTRITRIEKAYDDSVLASQRAGKWPPNELRAWAGRTSYVEPTDLAQASDLMFKQVSEVLYLLDKQQGQFEVKGGAFAFKDLNAKQEYNAKRIWIAQRMDSWSSTPETARPLTVTQILKALGDGLPGVQ
ncbi:MAG TPA: hypothetical protein VLB12_12625, partial [Gemmatimonadales bacterium]|nr:hypothetical protein [Gemmatimonadales bacterium]